MINTELIKDILDGKVTDYTISDIFSVDELEYENDILVYRLDSIDIDKYDLNDIEARSNSELEDHEKMTTEIRYEHGLHVLNKAIDEQVCGDIISSYLHLYKILEIDEMKIYISYVVYAENRGMGLAIYYDDAELEGIFRSYDEMEEYYLSHDYMIYMHDCNDECLKAKKEYILKIWDKDSLERETPAEKEYRLSKLKNKKKKTKKYPRKKNKSKKKKNVTDEDNSEYDIEESSHIPIENEDIQCEKLEEVENTNDRPAYASGLSDAEAEKLEELIEKFNNDPEYFRYIINGGNSMLLKDDGSADETAEKRLMEMALQSRY